MPVPIPKTVAWLGYGGLQPFIALAALVWLLPDKAPALLSALLAYGAVILSFVGALHWGFAIALPALDDNSRNASYVWSVIPALVAWVALIAPQSVAVVLLVSGFLLQYGRDRALAQLSKLPSWYLGLRLQLTCVACLCLIAAGVALVAKV